ncbi:pirin family protein [bacterium SCSIO 12741]|nr:pirin family protein [bacterium SCSIO 12741]
MRNIKQIIPAQKVNMGGIYLDQPLPARGVDQIDPFLLVHHWSDRMPGGQRQQDVGVPPHPHRGFAPVTFIFKGGVHHRDSTGHDGVIEAGGTQWMNSGSGIVHSERPAKELAEKGGEFELIQFWVNAPAANKMEKPSYQPLTEKQTPVVSSEDGKVNVGVVSGEFLGTKGNISTYSPLLTLRLNIQKGGKMTLPVPRNYNVFIYQLDGSMKVNAHRETVKKDLIWFENDGQEVLVEGLEDTRAILLAGAPINEPVATYGPFVMNSQREIMQALNDYQNGKMGTLTENFD